MAVMAKKVVYELVKVHELKQQVTLRARVRASVERRSLGM